MIRRWVLSLHKTVRKYFGEAIVVTQEVDDIISSPVVKESIINNSDCKILLDQKKYMNKFDGIQAMLGLTEKGESADTIHQPCQPPRTKIQRGMDRTERGAVGGVCYGSFARRIPDVHHRRERENGSVQPCGRVGRRLGACHQAAG